MSVMEEEIEIDLTEVYGCSPDRVKQLQDKRPGATKEEAAALADDVIARITSLQGSIDAIAEVAAVKIAEKARYINYLLGVWEPFLRSCGKTFMVKADDGTFKKKNIKFTSGGLYFRKTGGWRIADTVLLKTFLKTMNADDLAEIGVEWDLKIDRTRLIKAVKETGEVLPGVEFEAEDELGQMKVGTSKPWSANKALSHVKSAMYATTDSEEE